MESSNDNSKGMKPIPLTLLMGHAKNENAGKLGKQFMDLLNPGSCIEGWFSHVNISRHTKFNGKHTLELSFLTTEYNK